VCAVAIFPHVEVFLAALTVGSVAVRGAVNAVTTMSSGVVQIAVEETFV
jgi:hypothetical protein